MKAHVVLLALALPACGLPRPNGPAAPSKAGYIVSDGARLYYRLSGAGSDTLILVHGFQGNSSAYLAPDLRRLTRGRTLVVYDQRGGGRSGPAAPAGLDEHVRDLDALRYQLGISRMQLMGHSGGAAIVLGYAALHPDRVERAVLVSPPPLVGKGFGEQTARAFYSRLDSTAWSRARLLETEIVTSEKPRPACRELIRIILPRLYLADQTALRRMRGDFCADSDRMLQTRVARRNAFLNSWADREWTNLLASLEIPILVLHGEADAIPVAASRELVGHLSHGRLVMLPNADHLPWLDQPGPFFAASESFLQQ